MKRIIKISLILLLVGMAVIAAVPFLKEKRAEKKHENEFKKIQESVTEKKKNISNLMKKNEECIGYVEILRTTISYPVMRTKDKPDFYLNHDFNRNYGFYGTPYLSAYCDMKKSDNLIIYGHNINGRRYFGYLQNFREETFFKEHPKFSFTAVGEKEKEYCVVSVLETDKYADYYSFTDYGNEEDYCRMVEKILSHSKFQSEAAKKMKKEIEESGAEAFFRKYQFVTLSTCRTMDGKDKRLMVIGCRKR